MVYLTITHDLTISESKIDSSQTGFKGLKKLTLSLWWSTAIPLFIIWEEDLTYQIGHLSSSWTAGEVDCRIASVVGDFGRSYFDLFEDRFDGVELSGAKKLCDTGTNLQLRLTFEDDARFKICITYIYHFCSFLEAICSFRYTENFGLNL